MDTLSIFQFLVDGNQNYLEDGLGNRLINSTTVYPVDLSSASIASYRKAPRKVNSFNIISNANRTRWSLTINQHSLVGIYSTQAMALGALVGCFINADADREGFEFMISEMVQEGRGHIDVSENSIFLRESGISLESTIGDIVTSMIDPAQGADQAYFHVIQLQPFTDSGDSVTGDFLQVGTLPVSGDNTITAAGAYENLAEGASARSLVALVDVTTLAWVDTNIISNTLTKPSSVNPVIDFSVDIDQAILFEISNAIIDENSTGGTPTYTYEWYRSTNVVTGVTLTNEG